MGGGRGTISGAPSLLSFSLLEFVFAQQSGGVGKGERERMLLGEECEGGREREKRCPKKTTRETRETGGGEIRSMRTVLEGAD